MVRLAGVSGRKAVAAFCRAGYRVARQRGSHIILRRRGYPNLVIPNHRSVAPFLLRAQVRRAGLTEEEFLDLLS
ncbi:MAG: type II toxin-antitoxin system HicA family toxin [Phycisphaerae bacterium]|nr:type II toxin-antitoxin system HicA family toxin [Phycisphaerae bacterium]